MEDVITTGQGDNSQARFYFILFLGGARSAEKWGGRGLSFVISSFAFNLNRLPGCSRKTVLKSCAWDEGPPTMLDTAMEVLFVAGWRGDCHLEAGTCPATVRWPFQIMWRLHFPQCWQVRSASAMTVVESSQNCVIRFWEKKVLSVCSALGQQLKTALQHRGTAGGGAALIRVHPSNIDGANWGS